MITRKVMKRWVFVSFDFNGDGMGFVVSGRSFLCQTNHQTEREQDRRDQRSSLFRASRSEGETKREHSLPFMNHFGTFPPPAAFPPSAFAAAVPLPLPLAADASASFGGEGKGSSVAWESKVGKRGAGLSEAVPKRTTRRTRKEE